MDVENDYLWETEISGVVQGKTADKRRWIFEDHEGYENHLFLATISRLHIPLQQNEEDSGCEEEHGKSKWTVQYIVKLSKHLNCVSCFKLGSENNGVESSESDSDDGDESQDETVNVAQNKSSGISRYTPNDLVLVIVFLCSVFYSYAFVNFS